MKTQFKHSLIAALAIITFSVFTGCTGGGGGDGEDDFIANHELNAEVVIEGGDLACSNPQTQTSTEAATVTADDHISKANISKEGENLYETPHQERSNAKNVIKRLASVITSTSADGNVSDTGEQVHPIVIAYAEQVIGDYALNDGSADIGDPYHIDDVFVSTSLDNGKTWKKVNVSRTADKSSIDVTWEVEAGLGTPNPNPTMETVAYPGHSHKPTMEVNGDRILLAWHDKYCPSGDPLDLFSDDSEDKVLNDPEVTDYYKVNGAQGSINYNLDCSIADDPETAIDESNCAPNGNEVYEVPFSCAWTARGIFDPETSEVTWHKAEQLTSGTRDANKLWIAAAKDVGFAMSWQEDPEGLREGKGAGPGDGWSGATTNHGADIWYAYLKMEDFDAVIEDEVVTEEDNATKAKSLNNFSYPVRVTDNEVCLKEDTKEYCQEMHCSSYVVSNQGTAEKCVREHDYDPLLVPDLGETTEALVALDGDTGASRPAMTILMTDADVPAVVLAYEETKGLSESDPGVPNEGEEDTDIALEGKVVYFDIFPFDNPDTISAGHIVNPRYPDAETGELIFENARRVVIVKQVDPCDEGAYTFGLLYKQGVETRGGSSDMFLRMNTGFAYDTFVPDNEVVNVSSMGTVTIDGTNYDINWTSTNLEDYSYTNLDENTFSPRGIMRGDDIYIGFEYTPMYSSTVQNHMPNTFYIHRFADDGDGRKWQGPQQISKIVGQQVSTLDPRFITTPKGNESSGLASDISNPDVLFLTYGTFDMDTGHELDLYWTRSTDKGVTWETIDLNVTEDDNVTLKVANEKLSARQNVAEMEVQSLATPDGTMLFNAWLQEETHEEYINPDSETPLNEKGMDSWFGRVDFNVTTEVVADPID